MAAIGASIRVGKAAFRGGKKLLAGLGDLAFGGGKGSARKAVRSAIPSSGKLKATRKVAATSPRRAGLFRSAGTAENPTGQFSFLRTAGTVGGGLFAGQLASEGLRTATGEGIGERVAGLLGAPSKEDEAQLLEELAALEEEGLLEEARQAESQLFRSQVGTPFERRFGTQDERLQEMAFLEQVALPAATGIGVSLTDLLGDISRGSPFLHNLTAGERSRLAQASSTTGPVSAPQKGGGNAEINLQAGLAGLGG